MTKNTENKICEYHVASLVAYPIFAQLDEVKEAIRAVDGTEIHATSEEGKIVFTIEGTSYKDIGKKMDIIRVHKGIINLSPVYHQILDESNADNVAQ
jgi:nitrate reductase NapD